MTVPSSQRAEEIVHACPPGDSGTMPCCGRTPFEVSPFHRITLDSSLVTCRQPCACNRALMASLTPMHPKRYLDLACDEHRREFVAGSPVWADYVPDDGLRAWPGVS